MTTGDDLGRGPGEDNPAPAAAGTGREDGRGVRRRARAARERGEGLLSELERRRPESPLVETGFRWLARDKRIAGGILGGGLAYRFFFWALALSVLTSGGLGLASRVGWEFADAATAAGLSDSVAGSAADVGAQAQEFSLWLLIVGCVLVVWFGWGVLRALWLVPAAAWRVDPPPLGRVPQGVAGVVVTPFALVLLAGVATWVRAHIGLLPGVVATVAVGILFGCFWLWAQVKLPSADVPLSALVPGALAVTLGVEAIHLFSVYFLSDKLQNASDLYGVLGLASTLLFVLFMLGRTIVWGAELNAVTWDVRRERRHADGGQYPPT